MKKIYLHSLWFWFILLTLAIINGITRDLTYKPLLEPYIGIWAHQISCLTGIILFFTAIYIFLKYIKANYTRYDLFGIGTMWMIMTIIFEFTFGYFYRQSSWEEMFAQYHFWKGDLWIFVLLSVIIIPQVCFKILRGEK